METLFNWTCILFIAGALLFFIGLIDYIHIQVFPFSIELVAGAIGVISMVVGFAAQTTYYDERKIEFMNKCESLWETFEQTERLIDYAEWQKECL